MANSLRVKLKKLRHDGKISEQELQTLLNKLDGHDKQLKLDILNSVIEDFDKHLYSPNKKIILKWFISRIEYLKKQEVFNHGKK